MNGDMCERFDSKKNCIVSFCFSQKKATRGLSLGGTRNARRQSIIKRNVIRNSLNARGNIKYYNTEESPTRPG